MFLPNLFCVLEVSDDVHQGIAACTPFVFFSGLHIFTCGSLFFLSVWFRSLHFGASTEFLKDYFCAWLVRTLSFGWFCSEFSFFVCASFTYLELLPFLYGLWTFLDICLIFQCLCSFFVSSSSLLGIGGWRGSIHCF